MVEEICDELRGAGAPGVKDVRLRKVCILISQRGRGRPRHTAINLSMQFRKSHS